MDACGLTRVSKSYHGCESGSLQTKLYNTEASRFQNHKSHRIHGRHPKARYPQVTLPQPLQERRAQNIPFPPSQSDSSHPHPTIPPSRFVDLEIKDDR